MAEYVLTPEEKAKAAVEVAAKKTYEADIEALVDQFYDLKAKTGNEYRSSLRWRDFIGGQALSLGIVQVYTGG